MPIIRVKDNGEVRKKRGKLTVCISLIGIFSGFVMHFAGFSDLGILTTISFSAAPAMMNLIDD